MAQPPDSWANAFNGTWLVDLVIVLSMLELIALWAYNRRTGAGIAPARVALNILSGVCLMLALRGLLSGWGSLWMAACLSSAGLLHALDLWRSWRTRQP